MKCTPENEKDDVEEIKETLKASQCSWAFWSVSLPFSAYLQEAQLQEKERENLPAECANTGW